MRQFGGICTGGTPAPPGSIALRLTNEKIIKYKNRADYTKSTRFAFCPAGKPGGTGAPPVLFILILPNENSVGLFAVSNAQIRKNGPPIFECENSEGFVKLFSFYAAEIRRDLYGRRSRAARVNRAAIDK